MPLFYFVSNTYFIRREEEEEKRRKRRGRSRYNSRIEIELLSNNVELLVFNS